MKIIIGAIVVIVLVAVGLWFYNATTMPAVPEQTETENQDGTETTEDTTEDEDVRDPEEVIGQSVEGNDITAHHYGVGETELLFVGGIHGGYSWNTSLLAFELMDYLEENPEVIPENITVTVIPVMNPDGLEAVAGTTGRFEASDVSSSESVRIAGRFNANDVDLNRNFDCDWSEESTWQSRTVSGGEEVFSEPEAVAVRDYVLASDPDAVVVWYSAVGGVFASNCHDGVLPETSALTNLYAEAANYRAYESFDFYDITGDMVNWLAKENIPAISVLLSNHEDVEWTRNRAGIRAMLDLYGTEPESETDTTENDDA